MSQKNSFSKFRGAKLNRFKILRACSAITVHIEEGIDRNVHPRIISMRALNILYPMIYISVMIFRMDVMYIFPLKPILMIQSQTHSVRIIHEKFTDDMTIGYAMSM